MDNGKLKIASYDIVFQEIPGEVTLALNLSNCPCHCPGCHSPHLWEDIGEPLDEQLLDALIAKYAGLITCVCFMGGDADPAEVARLAEYIKNCQLSTINCQLKTAWYSGRPNTPNNLSTLLNPNTPNTPSIPSTPIPFTFLKFGPYIEALGGLKSPTTNQRLYKRVGNKWEDITRCLRDLPELYTSANQG